MTENKKNIYINKISEIIKIHSSVADNSYDVGIFVWGAAMNKLNIPYIITRVGAEVNAILNSKRDNNKEIGLSISDDPADVMAYTRGYYWKAK